MLEKVDTLVVDKTGTLTEGKPRVVSVVAEQNEGDVLRLAASLERASEHPLAGAVVRCADERGLTIPRAESGPVTIVGRGVTGTVEGRGVVVGNGGFAQRHADRARSIRGAGGRSARRRADRDLCGGGRDRVRNFGDRRSRSSHPTAAAIQFLRKEGIHVVMLTGDSRTTAESVARKLGIDEVEAEVLPDGKAEIVKRLQSRGPVVAMAGTASTMPRRWRRRKWESRWARARTWRWRAPGSR